MRHQLDDWHDRGLIDDDTHARLVDDLAGRDVASRSFAAAGRALVLEAVGYVGAALIVGALLFLFDVPSWGASSHVVLFVLVAVLTTAAAMRLYPSELDALNRLASLLAAASAGSAAAAVGLFASNTFGFDAPGMCWSSLNGCPEPTWVEQYLAPITASAAATALAAFHHFRIRRTATHLALGAAAFTLLGAATASIVEPMDVHHSTETGLFGVAFVIAGLAWAYASETGRLTPTTVGTVGATFAAGCGVGAATELTDGMLLVGLAAAAGYIAAGIRLDRVRLTALGGVGVLVFTPWTLHELFGLSALTTAWLLLPVGVALLLWVFRAARDS